MAGGWELLGGTPRQVQSRGGGLLGESHTLNSRTLPQASGSLKPPQFSSVFQRSQELGKGQGPCARADQSGDPAGNMFLSPPGKQ